MVTDAAMPLFVDWLAPCRIPRRLVGKLKEKFPVKIYRSEDSYRTVGFSKVQHVQHVYEGLLKLNIKRASTLSVQFPVLVFKSLAGNLKELHLFDFIIGGKWQ